MKKHIQSTESHSLEHHLKDYTEDHPLITWLENNGKMLLIGAASVAVLLFATYRLSSGSTAKAESDYIEASQQFALFQKNNDQAAFNKLETILNRRPELHPTYDGQLAQLFLDKNETANALPYATRVFNRVNKDNVPTYEEFAAITLLISQNEYSQALKRSNELKQTLLKEATDSTKERSFGDFLFAYNLLRISLLEQKAGTPAGELAAWSEWKTYSNANANSASIKAAAFYTLNSLFSEGPLTLDQYIKARENALKQYH